MVVKQRDTGPSFFWLKEFERDTLTGVNAHASLGLLLKNSMRVLHFLMNNPDAGKQTDLFIDFDLRLHSLRSILTISAILTARNSGEMKRLATVSNSMEERTSSIAQTIPSELHSYLCLKNSLAHATFLGTGKKGGNKKIVSKAVGHCLERWGSLPLPAGSSTQFQGDVAEFEKTGSLRSVFQRRLFANKETRNLLGFEGSGYPHIFDSKEFRFWGRWYQGFLNGEPLGWDLQLEIALIPSEDWDQGPNHIAVLIQDIERKYRTSVGRNLVEMPSGIWDIDDDVFIPKESLDFAIAQVELSLTSVLAAGPGNGLIDTSPETVLIRGACGKYKSQPSVVATTFWNACMSLQRNIGDIYPETASLIVLQNVLYTSVEEICSQDELIRARVAKLAALEKRRYPTPQEKEELAKVPDLLVDDMTTRAQDELREMVDIIQHTDKPPRIWRAKLVNWITTLGIGIDKAQKNEKRGQWLLGLARRIAGWFFGDDDNVD